MYHAGSEVMAPVESGVRLFLVFPFAVSSKRRALLAKETLAMHERRDAGWRRG